MSVLTPFCFENLISSISFKFCTMESSDQSVLYDLDTHKTMCQKYPTTSPTTTRSNWMSVQVCAYKDILHRKSLKGYGPYGKSTGTIFYST